MLGRLSGAFALTLSTLLARVEADASGYGRIARSSEQPIWRDPATHYLRRTVSPPGAQPELVQVELPPGACVAYPATAYAHLRGQCVWVLSGELLFCEAMTEHRLASGDCLALGLPTDCAFRNPSPSVICAYLVALAVARLCFSRRLRT